MSTASSNTIPAPRRELAFRSSGGLEIALYWNADDNTTEIEVHQTATEETINFPVPPDRALDAFHHPFAHIADRSARRHPGHKASYDALTLAEGHRSA